MREDPMPPRRSVGARPYSWVLAARPSRTAGVAAALLVAARVAGAQDTTRDATLDSLVARLRALEASVEVLQRQVADAATTGVQTRSRIQVELSGRVAMNAFSNERIVNNVDDPQFVRRDTAAAVPLKGFGMGIRQTMLGLRATVSDVLGGSFHGVMDVDFYGGQQPSTGGRTFPLLRIRTANGTLTWSHAELLAGQDVPLFSPLNPVSPAAVGTPDFVGAGNLWLWLPQLRGTVETGSTVKLALQGAVLAPTSGDAAGAFDTDFDAAERTRRPYLESRLRARWGEFEMAGEVGCAAHVGWVSVPAAGRSAPDSMLTSKALGCDARVSLGSWLELRGEAYTGQLVRGLGGGAIGQGVGANGRPVRNDAGWAQLNVRPPGSIASGGVGCGADHPRADDLPRDGTARLRNTACAVHALLKPAGPVFLGAEARRIATQYANARYDNNHLNLAIGFEF